MAEPMGIPSLSLPSGAPAPYSILRRTELDSQFRFRDIHGSLSLARRLQRCGRLQRHTGCVNRLSFSSDGSCLASVSDDASVCLWDMYTHKLRAAVPTGHRANVFGVRFMPQTGLSKVATGGWDKSVRITEVEAPHQSRVFACHGDRVKTVEVDQTTPAVVISASEDGTVRLFDIRERTESSSLPTSKVLVRIPDPQHYFDSRGVKSACLNPVDPMQLLVSSDSVRIFDRRKLSSSTASPCGPADAAADFLPRHLSPKSPERATPVASAGVQVFSTYASFSEDGTQVVATFSADAVYVFDTTRALSSPIAKCQTRLSAPRGSSRDARIRRLLASALRSVDDGAYTDAICTLNDLLSFDSNSVLALHMRCECHLMRGWVSDHRAALADAESLRRMMNASPSQLESIVRASLLPYSGSTEGRGKLRSQHFELWMAALELQRAEAIVGIVLPRGHFPRWTNMSLEQDLETRSRLLLAVDTVSRLESRVLRLLERENLLHNMEPFYLRCLRYMPLRMKGIRNAYTSACTSLQNSRGQRQNASRRASGRTVRPRTTGASGCPDRLEARTESTGRDQSMTQEAVSAGLSLISERENRQHCGAFAGTASPSNICEAEIDRAASSNSSDCIVGDDSCGTSGESSREASRLIAHSIGDSDAAGCGNCAEESGSSRRRRRTDGEAPASMSELTKRQRFGGGSTGENEPSDEEEIRSCDSDDSDEEPTVVPANDYFWGDYDAELRGYKRQLVGHVNTDTDIKEASFYGSHCVLGGSDDGHIYVWETATGRLVR